MADFKENVTAICDDGFIYCEYQTQKYINKIKKYKELYPDDVRILSETKDGGISAKLKVSRFNFSVPKDKREITDEQKEKASERFKQMWADKDKEK